MVFSSPVFLFLFLPLTLAAYGLAALTKSTRVKNSVLLAASVCFYGYGGFAYLGLLFLSVAVNWAGGLWMEAHRGQGEQTKRRMVFAAGLVWNIGILVVFKYLNLLGSTGAYLAGWLTGHTETWRLPQIALPIGISFFTFQIMSYFIDVYQEKVPAQKNLADLALYVMLFPQLIAGPIVRYVDVNRELSDRSSRLEDLYEGAMRFMAGFIKKLLLANVMGKAADLAFGLKPGMGMIYAWIGIICYGLQIYLDFWAYSDMAIGLGRIFGFRFLENFRDPYCSRSIGEFWRRWHISLSSWFRDYVYIPLGGSRCGKWKNCRNYLIVFALTGIWHGASWSFLFWGLYFAVFLIGERLGFINVLRRLPGAVQRAYVLAVVGIGWVFFRAEHFGRALEYLREMFFPRLMGSYNRELAELAAGPRFLLLFAVSVLFCTPFMDRACQWLKRKGLAGLMDGAVVVLFFLAACEMMASGYNPFIYFRF